MSLRNVGKRLALGADSKVATGGGPGERFVVVCRGRLAQAVPRHVLEVSRVLILRHRIIRILELKSRVWHAIAFDPEGLCTGTRFH